jgi:drug/metabolite transporter (DMT)-like permease
MPDVVHKPSTFTIGGLFCLLCLIWGSTWLVIKEGLADLPPLTSAGMRFTVAALFLALLMAATGRRDGGSRPPRWLWMTMGSLNFSVSYGLVYQTETVLPSGLVSVLWGVYPLMMAILAHRFLPGERLGLGHGLGFLLGFAGVVLLFLTDVKNLGPEAIGLAALLMLSPLASAVSTFLVKKHGSGCSSMLLNRNAMALGAGILLASAAVGERGQSITWTDTAIFSIAYLALLGTVVTFTIYFWLLRHCSASKLSLIAFVTPCVALLLGQTLGGEQVTANTLLGTAMILTGVGLGMRRHRG